MERFRISCVLGKDFVLTVEDSLEGRTVTYANPDAEDISYVAARYSGSSLDVFVLWMCGEVKASTGLIMSVEDKLGAFMYYIQCAREVFQGAKV